MTLHGIIMKKQIIFIILLAAMLVASEAKPKSKNSALCSVKSDGRCEKTNSCTCPPNCYYDNQPRCKLTGRCTCPTPNAKAKTYTPAPCTIQNGRCFNTGACNCPPGDW